MPKLRDVLTKVYDLCKARGFVFERSFNLAEENSTALDYGPLGIQIKRSLFNEWWHEIVTSRENVYGIELGWPYLHKRSIVRETGSTRFNKCERLSDYLSITYKYACELMEIHSKDSPAGLAQSLTVVQNGNDDNDKFMFRYVFGILNLCTHSQIGPFSLGLSIPHALSTSLTPNFHQNAN